MLSSMRRGLHFSLDLRQIRSETAPDAGTDIAMSGKTAPQMGARVASTGCVSKATNPNNLTAHRHTAVRRLQKNTIRAVGVYATPRQMPMYDWHRAIFITLIQNTGKTPCADDSISSPTPRRGWTPSMSFAQSTVQAISSRATTSAPANRHGPAGSKRAFPRRITRVPIIFRRGGELVGEEAIWPLIPVWARGEVPKYSTANARSEEMAGKPAYRNAWRREQRCLIYASGFYEWQARPGGKIKQP